MKKRFLATKIALFLLVSALTVATLASCGSDSAETTTAKKNDTPINTTADQTTSENKGTTTAPQTTNSAETTSGAQTTGEAPETTPATTDGEAAPSTPATTEGEGETTTKPETSESQAVPSTPETPDVASVTGWVDNNGDDVSYEITVNADGTVKVSYTKEDYASAEAKYGYAGFSWVNMKADISESYTGQSKLVMKIKGESGKSLLIKPFDDQAFEKTMNFDGSEQEITIELNNVKADANKVIILFGDGGATDTTGEFTIIEAYFAD